MSCRRKPKTGPGYRSLNIRRRALRVYRNVSQRRLLCRRRLRPQHQTREGPQGTDRAVVVRGLQPRHQKPRHVAPSSQHPPQLPSEILVPENQRQRLSSLKPHCRRPWRQLPNTRTRPTRPYGIYLNCKPTTRAGRNASSAWSNR